MNKDYDWYIADIKYEEKKLEELMVDDNKSPAVLFYTSDFLSNTRTMTFNDIGMLITLLCLQHQNGHLSELDMLCICGKHNDSIYRFFIKDNDGKYYNKRFEDECIKRKKFVESRRSNRSKKTYVKHMENENVNENINVYVNENNYSNSLKESILAWLEYKVQRNENYQEQGFKSLLTQIKNRIDKFGEEKVIDVIELSMSSNYKGIIWDKIQNDVQSKNKSNFDLGQEVLKELRES